MLQDVNGKVPLKLETRSLKLETRNSNPPKAPQGADERFDRFWKAYPKKKSKGDAKRAWGKVKHLPDILEKITDSLIWQVRSEDWIKDNGQFIPNPATYLNGGCWEDEPVIPFKPKSRAEIDTENSRKMKEQWERENAAELSK